LKGKNIINKAELKHKVYSVASRILKEKILISPVDVLMDVDVLSVKNYPIILFLSGFDLAHQYLLL
jgi:hypothetical protein